MKDIQKMLKTAIASLITLTTATTFANGIVKAALNDCQTSTQSCAGSSTKDRQADAFIFLPNGSCNKIVGGSLTIPAVEKSK